MAHKVAWTPRAEESFVKIIRYLEENWTEKEIRKFIIKADHIIDLISDHPKSFLKSEKKGIHKARINKQNSLFYRVRENQIELLLFWDGRQDPSRLNKLLR